MLPLFLSSTLGFGSFGGSTHPWDGTPCSIFEDNPSAAPAYCLEMCSCGPEKEARAAGIGALGRRELSATCVCGPVKESRNGAGGIGALGRRELTD